MDPKRFTRRLVALGAAMFLVALVFVVTLFDAQIVHGDDYLAKSIRTNAKVETVKGTRGVITDRNGKVLVSNRAVYTLNFDLSLVSSDELNDALLRLIELMHAQGVEIRDILPLSQEAPYVYDTAKGGVRALVKYLVSLKWMDEKNVDEDGLPTSITGPALYLRLCSEYGVSEALPDDTARTLVGLRYALASARLNGSTVFEFASDVDVALISLIKDGSYAGVQVDTSSVRVYETDYAAHVLGYTGSIEDWDDYKDKDGYTLASIVGKSGAESAFEEYLHGSDGKRLVTFNDSGKVTGEPACIQCVQSCGGDACKITRTACGDCNLCIESVQFACKKHADPSGTNHQTACILQRERSLLHRELKCSLAGREGVSGLAHKRVCFRIDCKRRRDSHETDRTGAGCCFARHDRGSAPRFARGRRAAARASGAGARAAVRRPLTCCAWPPIAAFPPRRRTRETRWRISGDIFRSTSAASRTGSLWRFMRTRVCPAPRPTGLPFGACWQRKRKLT